LVHGFRCYDNVARTRNVSECCVRGHVVRRPGCSVMIYELRTSRITTAYSSRLRVDADALLVSADVGYVIAVIQDGCVVVWRVKNLRCIDPYHKYMSDDFPADDRKLSDTDYYYDEAADQQVRVAESRVLVHGQVTIIFVVSVGFSVCLFVQSFSQPSLIRFRSN